MSKTQLGKLIDHTAKRDAVHIAIAPVVAGGDLQPGEHVGFIDGAIMAYAPTLIGVVDPFLKEPLVRGDKFWLLLYPQTITDLRHEWSHPAFPEEVDEVAKAEALAWMKALGEQLEMPFEKVMSALADYVKDETEADTNFREQDITSEQIEEMWMHYETLTGTKVASNGGTPFRCCA